MTEAGKKLLMQLLLGTGLQGAIKEASAKRSVSIIFSGVVCLPSKNTDLIGYWM